MTFLINTLALMCLLISSLVCGYYWVVAIAAMSKKGETDPQTGSFFHSFAIVIPAHNEEKNIANTLASCRQLEYPEQLVKIVVVADNCSDNTSEIVRSHGITCYERIDQVNKGKGFALAFAFEKLVPEDIDAFIVLDADCTIDSSSLNVINSYLCKGEQVLQLSYTASNPDASPMSYAVAVGNFIENEFFYAGKSRLGLSVFLRGTGMVLHREALKLQPWDAYSVVEDVDYSLKLIRKKISTRFVHSIKVQSEFPVSQDQLDVQRTRWADGNIGFGKTMAARLVLTGIQEKNWQLVDAGWTLLILSKPLVICWLILSLFLSWIAVGISANAFTILLITGTLSIFGLQLAYYVRAVLLMGLSSHRLCILLQTPIVIIRLIWIALKALLGVGIQKWIRTPR